MAPRGVGFGGRFEKQGQCHPPHAWVGFGGVPEEGKVSATSPLDYPMPISASPTDWRDLQAQVALILRECGMDAHIEHVLPLVRGQANIDVYATDAESVPPSVYLCECKQWSTAVPQTIVHSFRTVVADAGANFGLLISSAGFQSGAIHAAANSNVKLLNWEEFQRMFLDRWLKKHLAPSLASISEPLVDYTEPMNTRIFRKADALSKEKQLQFIQLRERYAELAFFALALYMPMSTRCGAALILPLVRSKHDSKHGLPADLMHETLLRPFLTKLTAHIEHGIREFDAVFGGRA